MMSKIHAVDAGTWLDGSMGWHNKYRVIEVAEGYGFEVDPTDADIIGRLKEHGQGGCTEDEWWSIFELSEEATNHLNDLAPEGFLFEWDAGELSLVELSK